ncbi:hypothetical protein M422DRAFT_239602 [Sphaerobolus stellatus SS14]|nr:hypothetical protein M422DRAFT_239602 [Sphaerobolus stellatus SS14]
MNPLNKISLTLIISLATLTFGTAPVVKTTSGTLTGTTTNGVNMFKGIRFGIAPVGNLRWEPPQPFISNANFQTTQLPPSCVQQFAFAGQNLTELLFNTPPPPSESEDCLFLNVWAPANTTTLKPVLFWIYGGGLAFGTGSLPAYDGTSFAENQDIVVVTFNYRTNVFGFPEAEELFPNGENLGFLDQELALRWVQNNIAAFGGDKTKVTIQGESAGALSVATFIQRHPVNPPFRAGIMESGAAVSTNPTPSFTAFDAMSKAVGCNQSPGAARITCLKGVPAETIRAWTNGPSGLAFDPVIDNITAFAHPLQRIANHQTATVPIIIGNNNNDGTLFALGITDLPAFLNSTFGPGVTAAQVRALYPGQNDTDVVADVLRETSFLCPAELTATALIKVGQPNVFRYDYGAVFADLQKFPGAGAFHSSEIGEIFGTFNPATASPAEVTLSKTMQTVWANFIKNPTALPAPNWNRFVPGNKTLGLAKLAFNGNVELQNVVQAAPSNANDNPCDALFNQFLDF